MSRASLRVAVLHNAPALPPSHPDAVSEADVVEVALAVVDALRREGLDARPLAAAPPIGRLVESLDDPRPDVVFNLIEGFGGSSAGEARVTALLELMGLPYTGCPSEAQALCHSKGQTKAILRGLGLPTAPFALVGAGEPVPDLEGTGPWIVKPDGEDASLGIDQASVVTDRAALLGAWTTSARRMAVASWWRPISPAPSSTSACSRSRRSRRSRSPRSCSTRPPAPGRS